MRVARRSIRIPGLRRDKMSSQGSTSSTSGDMDEEVLGAVHHQDMIIEVFVDPTQIPFKEQDDPHHSTADRLPWPFS